MCNERRITSPLVFLSLWSDLMGDHRDNYNGMEGIMYFLVKLQCKFEMTKCRLIHKINLSIKNTNPSGTTTILNFQKEKCWTPWQLSGAPDGRFWKIITYQYSVSERLKCLTEVPNYMYHEHSYICYIWNLPTSQSRSALLTWVLPPTLLKPNRDCNSQSAALVPTLYSLGLLYTFRLN